LCDNNSQQGKWQFRQRSIPAACIVFCRLGPGQLQIEPQQAEVVRRIFRMSAEGFALGRIAKTLNQEGVPANKFPL
jgi:hypothetical protein